MFAHMSMLHLGRVMAVLMMLLHLVAAAPAVANGGSSITVNKTPIVKNSHPLGHHRGLAAYARALRKYGASAHIVDHISALAVKHGKKSKPTGKGHGKPSDIATPQPIAAAPSPNDQEYNSPIMVGSQNFALDFDTGSSDLWVIGDDAVGSLPNQTVYTPGPTASQIENATFFIEYGDNTVVGGDVYMDSISLGGIKVDRQAVEVVSTDVMEFAEMDGIVGLGFDNINSVSPHRQKTLFTTLISSNLIPQPVLSVDLRHQAVGCYTFGSVPSYQYTGAITYTPADGSRGYWMFSPTGYGVGSGNNNTAINSTAAAVAKTKGIADTGTSLIIIDYDVASQYWARSETASFSDELYGWIFDCGEQLPDFTLQIGGPGGFEAVVPGEFLNYDEVDLEDGSNSCYGGIQPDIADEGFAIYGDVLLKSVFAVFDRGSGGAGPRLGFAAKA